MSIETDWGAIVRMLRGYADLIDRDCQRRFAELGRGGDLPAKRKRLAELNAIIADYQVIVTVEETCRALEEVDVDVVRRIAGARH